MARKKRPSEGKSNIYNGEFYMDSLSKHFGLSEAPKDNDEFVNSGLKDKLDATLASSDYRFEYILHDEDKVDADAVLAQFQRGVDEADRYEVGDAKKPHIHYMLGADKRCTLQTVRRNMTKLFDDDKDAMPTNLMEITNDVADMQSYLTHDSFSSRKAGKHQYPKDRLITINDFDYQNYLSYSRVERKNGYRLVMDAIEEYNLTNAKELSDYVRNRQHEKGMISIDLYRDVFSAYNGPINTALRGQYQALHGREDIEIDRRIQKTGFETVAKSVDKLVDAFNKSNHLK